MNLTNINKYRYWTTVHLFGLFTTLLFLAALANSGTAQQPGDLDPTFDGDGKRVDTFIPGEGNDDGKSVLIQSDGKIVTVGTSSYGNATVCSATRHLADGTLDQSFGSGGKVLLDPALAVSCNSAALQSDGKIVGAGGSGLVRFNTDGSIDTTFDGDGKVAAGINVYSVAIQSDGKIVAAGSLYNGTNVDFAIVRFNVDGSTDTTLDGDGLVTTDLGYDDYAQTVAIQSDGKIVTAGYGYYYVNCPEDPDGCIAYISALTRYNTDGSLDTTFDGDGKVIIQPDLIYGDSLKAVAIQPDGKIIAAGTVSNNGTSYFDFALLRFDTNGSLDTTFDGDGIVTTPISLYTDTASDLAIQPDGKILAAGTAGANGEFALVRYNPNGSLDTTLDGDGIVTTPIGSYFADSANAVAIQPDGKIVAAGRTNTGAYNGANSDFALVRYNPNGSLDAAGFSGGIKTTNIGHRGLTGKAVAMQPDGKIVAGGDIYNGTPGFAVVRYNTDGTRDNTFGVGGIVTTSILTQDGYLEHVLSAIAVQPDGKIIAAGTVNNGETYYDFTLVRYNPDGSLDTTFDGDGIVTTQILGCNLGYNDDRLHSIALQPDGKIVASGGTECNGIGYFSVVRYTTTGLLDTTFGGFGKVNIPVNGVSSAYQNAVAIQQDGKIVVAGAFALIRLNPNGPLDTTFDGDGILNTPFNSAIVLQTDSKIVVGRNDSIVRYDPGGTLDTTFDGDGIVTTSVGIHSLALQQDGKIIASAASGTNNVDFAIFRFNSNGSLDNPFGGGDGTSTADFNNSYDYAYNMTLDGQGRAVLVGTADGALAIARFILEDTGPTPTPTPTPTVTPIPTPTPTPTPTPGPATITVTNTNDSGAGSLRQAIADVAAGGTINFDPTVFYTPQTITLTSGQLVVDKSLTIRGPGANLLSISGNNISRVFQINSGVTLDGITVRDGYAGSLDECGGICGVSDMFTVTNTSVSGNHGGGIYVDASVVMVNNSNISGNGYGIGCGGCNLIVINSSVSGNAAPQNSEISGVGIGVIAGVLTVTHSTISGNSAGIASCFVYFDPSIVTLTNTIVAGNTLSDIFCPVNTASHNLIGDAASAGGIQNGVNGNIVGVNPLLGSLQNNGGTTMTHALLTGSPAINAGDNCVLTENGCGFTHPALTADQTGYPRIGTVDIGAFEFRLTTAATGSISGKTVAPDGKPITRALITLTDADGNARTTVTKASGTYKFSDLPIQTFYILDGSHRKYKFTARTVFLFGDITDENLTALNKRSK